ncbi:MAG: VanW family protein [Bacillota bacterium]
MERNKKRRKQRTRLSVLACLLVLLIVGAAGTVVSASGSRLPVGTRIVGVDVGGLSYEEAKDKLQAWLQWGQRNLVLEAGSSEFKVGLEELGIRPLVDATLAQVQPVLWWRFAKQPGELPLVVTLDENQWSIVMSHIKRAVEKEPVPAKLEIGPDDSVSIVKEVAGAILESESLKDVLLNGGKWYSIPQRVVVPLSKVLPEMTEKKVMALGVRKLIGSYSTRYEEDGKRSENIKIACSKIDGLLLAPGEVFSFNAVVGPRDESGGYQEANVFLEGRVVPGIGGGICQVSSTLYNAVLLANLKVVERHNHFFAVDYVPLSRDATVAWNGPDLVLKNTLNCHVVLKCAAREGVITAKVFGDAPPGQAVRIISEVLERIEFPTQTVVDPTKPQDFKKEEKGAYGYRSRAYRVILKDGKEVSRELLSVDYYKPRPRIVTTGAGKAGS